MKKALITALIIFPILTWSQEKEIVEEQIIISSQNTNIYGTLLLPIDAKEVPLALLIQGSGPTDRDGNQPFMKNNSLRFLAENLAKNGIATLRYDKRGVGKSQTSQQESELSFEDYVTDAQKWITTFSSDDRFNKRIIIGHSEGSLIGMITAQNTDTDIIISLCGPSKPADVIILEQMQNSPPEIFNETRSILDSLKNGHTVSKVNPNLYLLFRPSVQPYLISWIKYDPRVEIQKLGIPVLIIHGGNDIQINPNNASELAKYSKNAEIITIKNMNHILKNVEKDRNKNMATYNDPELPISEELIKEISDFIWKN